MELSRLTAEVKYCIIAVFRLVSLEKALRMFHFLFPSVGFPSPQSSWSSIRKNICHEGFKEGIFVIMYFVCYYASKTDSCFSWSHVVNGVYANIRPGIMRFQQ